MSKEMRKTAGIGRRDLLRAAGLGAVAATGAAMVPAQALASPEEVAMVVDEVTGGKKPAEGKITLGLPDVAENAATVRTTVTVESPMTDADHVKSIHIFGEQNPNATIASFHLNPMVAKAEVSTRVRLAKTQNVVAVAVMSDGSSYIAKKEVKVTIGGCGK